MIAKHKAIRNQAELQRLLQEQGVLATQSSISRDLRDLGVRRVKGVYVIKPSREGGWSFDDVIELVEMVARSGPYTTVIQTIPDAARLVARTLEEAGWEEVVGTVAGDDTIFVATRTEEDQDRLFERFKKYLSV
jgi:transcriptional regulator of arginine metabolism